jgi:DNA-binding transcriptional ArsR family regulator
VRAVVEEDLSARPEVDPGRPTGTEPGADVFRPGHGRPYLRYRRRHHDVSLDPVLDHVGFAPLVSSIGRCATTEFLSSWFGAGEHVKIGRHAENGVNWQARRTGSTRGAIGTARAMTSHTGDVGDVLTALADPMRRRLLDVLGMHGEGTATTIATELPVSRQAVVKRLAVLSDAGLVTGERSGREVRYRIEPQPLDATARWMAGLAVAWDVRLQAIKRMAESTGPTSTTGPSR